MRRLSFLCFAVTVLAAAPASAKPVKGPIAPIEAAPDTPAAAAKTLKVTAPAGWELHENPDQRGDHRFRLIRRIDGKAVGAINVYRPELAGKTLKEVAEANHAAAVQYGGSPSAIKTEADGGLSFVSDIPPQEGQPPSVKIRAKIVFRQLKGDAGRFVVCFANWLSDHEQALTKDFDKLAASAKLE